MWLLIINCIIALGEYALKIRIWEYKYHRLSYFRSAALFNHALNNTLIVVSLAPLLLMSKLMNSVLMFGLILLALFAFGGRAGMAVFVFITFILLVTKSAPFWNAGVKTSSNDLILSHILLLFLSVGLAATLSLTGIGDRIFKKLYIDDSAAIRFNLFLLLDQLTANEFWFGAGESLLDNIATYINTDTIENYFVGWIFQFGIIGAVPLFLSISMLLSKAFFSHTIEYKLVIISFFIVSISNNSLASKTPVLLLLFAAIFCATNSKKSIL